MRTDQNTMFQGGLNADVPVSIPQRPTHATNIFFHTTGDTIAHHSGRGDTNAEAPQTECAALLQIANDIRSLQRTRHRFARLSTAGLPQPTQPAEQPLEEAPGVTNR